MGEITTRATASTLSNACRKHGSRASKRSAATRTRTARLRVMLGAALMALMACHRSAPSPSREPLNRSAWVESAAVQRGYVKAGDFAQFGCPPGWMGVEETAAALRGGEVSTTYVGSDPVGHDSTITCVAQREFALPAQSSPARAEAAPVQRPLAPVWMSTTDDGITVGFRREVPLSAPIYIAQETPCGPRVIGIELGDLLKWLADPASGANRHFLGMISGGCPEQNRR